MIQKNYVQKFGINESESSIISNSKNLASFFEDCIEIVNDKTLLAKILVGDISSLLNKDAKEITDTNFTPENISQLINLISDGTISGKIAKDVLEQIRSKNIDPIEYIKAQGLVQISDEDAIEKIILEPPSANNKLSSLLASLCNSIVAPFEDKIQHSAKAIARPPSLIS